MILRADATRIPLADRSAHCVVTSPPYWGLRDYGVSGQIGLEKTPGEYIARMVGVFREVRRVLRDDGTLWLNIGDSYANDSKWGGSTGGKHVAGLHGNTGVGRAKKSTGLKAKDLVGIPWMLAFALRDDGWYLRSDIIWHKPNPMPESVTDRPSKAHEYVFLLAKNERYFYDADAVRDKCISTSPAGNKVSATKGRIGGGGGWDSAPNPAASIPEAGRNARTVWSIPTRPFTGSHFATMPIDLAERCIKAGTSERGVCPACSAPWVRMVEKYRTHNGERRDDIGAWRNTDPGSAIGAQGDGHWRYGAVSETRGWAPACTCPAADPVPARVFDPFGGAMTTVLAARRLGREGIATELSEEYARLGQARLRGSMYDISSVGTNDAHPLFDQIA